MNSRKRIRMLTEGALMVAAAAVLGMFKLWEMPWGGPVVLSMVPMVLYAVRWGMGPGLLSGFAYGLIVLMMEGGFAIGWQSIVGDYLLAFTVLGLAGVMKGRSTGVFWGTLIACGARFLVHWVVGATVWAAYMPETFLGMGMSNPWIYSALYNVLYMGPNTVITLVVFALLWKPLNSFLTGQDIAE